MPKKILSYFLYAFILISAFFAWMSISRAVFVEDSSHFLMPVILFSCFATFLGLSFILIKERFFSFIIYVFALALSLFFVSNPYHFISLSIGLILFSGASEFTRRDLENSIRVSPLKSLGRGMYEVSLALAIIISSQYLFSIDMLESQDIVPEFRINRVTTKVISFGLSKVSPEFEKVDSEQLSVDDFLDELYEVVLRKQTESISDQTAIVNSTPTEEQKIIINEMVNGTFEGQLSEEEIAQYQMMAYSDVSSPVEVSEEIRKSAVSQWKKSLSEAAGFEIKGDEKIADVMIALINSKVNDFVNTKEAEGKRFNALAIIFAAALLLALISLSTLLSRIWVWISYFIFKILKKTRAVEITTIVKEVQIIE